MKHCPICDARYDEEIIRFCTKDGTPLVEDEQPSFAALPSENLDTPDDDLGEETIIRRKPLTSDPAADIFASSPASERIVIPTSFPPEQEVRPRVSQAYFPPPPPPNTGKTVALTILGTIGVLGLVAVLFFFMRGDEPTNLNVNVNTNPINQNLNMNSNFAFDSNFNFNATANFNTNYNINTNLNTNLRTPAPTPTPRPVASPSATPAPPTSPTPASNATPRVNSNVRPSVSPTPRTGPRPPALNTNRPPANGVN